MRACKLCVCDESIRIKLENLIEGGLSYLKASSYAKKEFGFSVSHTSIQRHYENHKLKPKEDISTEKDISTDEQLKRTIINKLRKLVDYNITEFAKGRAQFPKEEGRLLSILEKTYKEDVVESRSDQEFYGPNDAFIILPGNQNYTQEEFENYMKYAKMMIGISTPKPTSNVIIEPPQDHDSF